MALLCDLLVIFTIGVTGPRQVFSELCPYNTPSCYCFSQTMVCTDLQELPPLQTGSGILNITEITFTEGNIRTIPANTLPPNLTTLTFTSHPLTNISEDAFQQSAATLKYLTISHASFNQLPKAFVKLDDLNHFNLDHTDIHDWDTATFENSATSLTNLALVSMGLTEWPTWFSLFRSLQVVDFSNNSIKFVPDDAFRFLNSTLLHLTLTDCNLTQLPKALSSLINLAALDLSGNILTSVNGRPAIEQLGMFPLKQMLVILQLKYSGLKVIPNFTNLTKLSRIDLDYNQITDSTSGSFSSSVTSLDLGENNLPSVPTVVAGMNNLTFLDLSYNKITSVSFDTLPLPLDMVDLSGNKISQINDTTTKELSELTYLYLYKNPITTIPNSIFERMAALETLELQSTNLTTIPLGLTLLPKVKTLDLRNIDSLSCPCPTPTALVTWFTPLQKTVTNIGVCSSGVKVEEYLRGNCNTAGLSTVISFPVCCSCLVFLFLAYFSGL